MPVCFPDTSAQSIITSTVRRFTTVITNTSEHVNLCAVMLAPIQTHSSQVGYVCDLDVIQGATLLSYFY